MVGEVNGLQEKEEMTAETAEEQLVENAAETTPSPETETAEAAPVEDKAAALEAELKEKSDRILRLQADFENFRRRTAKEKEELAAVITQNILGDLLPLLDNFERAMAVEQTAGEAFQKGVVSRVSRQRDRPSTRISIRRSCVLRIPTLRTERSRRCCKRATRQRAESSAPQWYR